MDFPITGSCVFSDAEPEGGQAEAEETDEAGVGADDMCHLTNHLIFRTVDNSKRLISSLATAEYQ